MYPVQVCINLTARILPAFDADPKQGQPLLYSYRRCPYAMRARMALLLAGQPFLVHDVVLHQKPAQLLAISPKGTVPVLQLPGGEVLEQSWDIMAWALQREGLAHWWQAAQTSSNLEALAINDGEFKRQLDRYKYPERFPDEPATGEQARSQAAAVLLLPLEARLTQHPWLGGEAPCATDLAIFPFVRQFAAVDPAWWAQQPWPALRGWLNHWLASPLFNACMVKVPAAQTVLFPAPAHAAFPFQPKPPAHHPG